MKKMRPVMPLPVVIAKEDDWFVASCPILNIATQGKTEKEVKENMTDLIEDYMKDPDTPKPSMKTMMSVSVSMTNIPVRVPEGVRHRETKAVSK
jgi:predicted RNase H-like HicB family nuclease